MTWKKLIIRELITIVATALVFVGILSIIGNQDVKEEDYYSTVSVIGVIIAVIVAALAAISYDEILDPFVVVAYLGAIASIITITNDGYTYITSLILAVLSVAASATSTTTVIIASSENKFLRKGKNKVFLILSYLLELIIITSTILIIVFLKTNSNILKLT